ncbi:MAG: HAMP domain-containing histidine kinase [Clostridiaceae bacterium]|jgi:signal transduction histidine kinase|nr:HAMP domain-containing histidine kinase [Clostridiaceae bacterium]
MNNLNEKTLCKLLKKLNTLNTVKEIAKETNSGLLKLIKPVAVWICILNFETNKIEYKKFDYQTESQIVKNKVKEISNVTVDLLTDNFEQEEALDYINSASKNDIILEPIIYGNNLLGYLGLLGEDESFNEKNVNTVQIVSENISSKLEIIYLNKENAQKEKYRVEFLAGISHEFKTPLNSIIGFSDMLKSKCVDMKNFKYIDNISKSSRFLLSLIQDILDLSRAQTKPLELNYQTFRPKEVIEDIILGFEEFKKEKDVEISYTLTDIELNADLKRFKQLIYNLTSNAIKFNKNHGKVTIVTYLNENNEYVFEIKDTGDGISKKDCGKIFGFFTQVSSNQLKRQQGSGVGLALCKKIVEAHGGGISFKSRLNSGSSFWFTLPINA